MYMHAYVRCVLAQRSAEFLGSTTVLFSNPLAASALRNLRSLNLYDNELTSIVVRN